MYMAATIANGEVTKTTDGQLKISLKVEGPGVEDMRTWRQGPEERLRANKASTTSALRDELEELAPPTKKFHKA